MKGFVRLLPLLVAAVFATSCGGGSSSSSPVAGVSHATGVTPFSVTVPSTAGITSVGITSPLEAGSPEHAIPTSGPSAQCTAQGANSVCSAALTLPGGAQTLGIAVHAAQTTRSALHVTLSSTRVALAVGTAIAQISVIAASTQFAGGTPATATVYVTAYDSNGNAIVGTYPATITLASSDPAVTLSPTSVTQSGATVTANYSGSTAVAASVTLSAAASGISASAVVNATLGFTASQIIYTAGGTGQEILQFPINASGNAAPMRRTFIAGVNGVYAIAPDGHGNLAFCIEPAPSPSITLVGGSTVFGGVMATIPLPQSDGTAVPQILSLPLGTQSIVKDCSTDGNGTMFALFVGAPAGIFAIPSGSSTPSRTISGSATGMASGSSADFATSIAVGPDGSLYVTDLDPTGTTPEILVFGPGANGNVAPVRTISGTATTLSNSEDSGAAPITVGPDGSLYVLDLAAGSFLGGTGNGIFGIQRVLVFAPNANGNVAPSRIISGGLTGLSSPTSGAASLASSSGREGLGIAVDAASNIYVGTYSTAPNWQILRFPAGSNGNVAPTNVLGGSVASIFPYDMRIAGGTVAPPAAAGPPSVSGDFMGYSPSRGWNYIATPRGSLNAMPPPPFTVTLYADPNSSNSSVTFALLQTAGTPGNASAGTLAADVTYNNASGYVATSVSSVSNAFSVDLPLPGGITVVPSTLTLGQTFIPYPGLTATVTNVGTVPGSGVCPTPNATGATVSYTFGSQNEVISYVPGCGITDLITDTGTEFALQSISSYPQLGTQSARRISFPAAALHALSSAWQSVFTPWRPKK
jgi:hypothetical protein